MFVSSNGTTQLTITTGALGVPGTIGVLPLEGAESASGSVPLAPNVDVSQPPLSGLVGVFPSDATVTAITARFVPSVQLSTLSPVTVTAQLYIGSSASSTVLFPAAASCTMTLSGLVVAGTAYTCSSTSSVPVAAGTPAFIVLSATGSLNILVNLVGSAATSLRVN